MPNITETGMHTMRVHAQAAQVLADIGTQANCVAEFWGKPDKNPDWALRTAVSAAKNTTQLFNAFFGGESDLARDGELSLFVKSSSGFVYGVIGHPIVRADDKLDDDIVAGPAPRLGRFCFYRGGSTCRDADATYCGKPVSRGEPTCTGHVPLIFAAPLPIEWSFHS